VGKTTTARIIARALNCEGPDGTGDPPPIPAASAAIVSPFWPSASRMCRDGRRLSHRRPMTCARSEVSRSRPMKNPHQGVHHRRSAHADAQRLQRAAEDTEERLRREVRVRDDGNPQGSITVLSRCQRFDLRRVRVSELHALFAVSRRRRVSRSSPPRSIWWLARRTVRCATGCRCSIRRSPRLRGDFGGAGRRDAGAGGSHAVFDLMER